MKCTISLILLLILPLYAHSQPSTANILNYGAVPTERSIKAAFANSFALSAAFSAVQSQPAPRSVLIPVGVFYAFNTTLNSVIGVTLQIDGTWIALDELDTWPNDTDHNAEAIFTFANTINFTIVGNGTIDGEGYPWWVRTIVTAFDNRPHMIVMSRAVNTLVTGIHMRNSPQYHMKLEDVDGLVIHGVSIHVDVEQQKSLLRDNGLITLMTKPGNPNVAIEIPTFPLNTDGIDPSGRNVHIYNCTIENFDDAVAVKPMNGNGFYSNCSHNMLIEDIQVAWGVGMTIGSVPPNDAFNCVRNITFRNVNFAHPIKAIYVKTNPGDHGFGIISDILYENMTIHDPVWWVIYVGPQQQQQPGGAGPGCMLYPLDERCPTDPRVPIYNVTLRNIVSTGGELSPGIIRCNATKPCHGFVFDNVNVQGTDWPHNGYICENIYGRVINSHPDPGCFLPEPTDALKRRFQ